MVTRPLSALGLDDADLAAWRAASALAVAAIGTTALTADALLMLGAQCVASAALAMDDLGTALDRTAEMAWALRQRMDGPAPEPVRILMIGEEADDA